MLLSIKSQGLREGDLWQRIHETRPLSTLTGVSTHLPAVMDRQNNVLKNLPAVETSAVIGAKIKRDLNVVAVGNVGKDERRDGRLWALKVLCLARESALPKQSSEVEANNKNRYHHAKSPQRFHILCSPPPLPNDFPSGDGTCTSAMPERGLYPNKSILSTTLL